MQLNSTWSLIVTAIPVLLVIASGVFKLSGSQQIVTALTKVGVLEYMKYLGIAEIIFAILFIYPPTNAIGFILLACYFSGALATDLSHKSSIVAPFVILVLLFIAEFITNNTLFLE
jgi:hypothetical protein